MNRTFRFQALGIVLLAFALRLIALGSRDIWYDDAFSIFLARQDLDAIVRGSAADTMPPLYDLMRHFWMLIGSDPFTLRFSSVIFSMLVVASVYQVARKLFSPRAARNATLFTAMAPFQILYAQELRMYSLLAFALLGYFSAFADFWRDERAGGAKPQTIFFLATFGALALYSHNLAFVTLVAADFFLLWYREWRALMKLISAQIVSTVLFIPWLLYIPGQLEKIQRAFWTLRPGFVEFIQLLMEFTTTLPLTGILFAVALFISLAIFMLAALETIRAIHRGAPDTLGIVLAFAIVPPILLFVLSFLIRPVFIPRGVILSSLAYYVLLGWLVSRVSIWSELALIVPVAAVIALALAYQYSYNEFPRSPFRAADQFLQTNFRNGDALVHDNKLTFFPMRYYAPELTQAFIADPPNSSNDTLARATMDAMQIYPQTFDDAMTGKSRIWFVIFQRALDEAAQENRVHENKAWMDAHFKEISLTRFNDLNVYLYQR